MLYCKKGVAAHRVVYLPDWLKPTCLGKVQGRLIYFRLLFLLSKQASNAIRKLPPKNNRLKISYVFSICTTSLPFRAREVYHLVTRLRLRKIIAYLKLSGNLFSVHLCYVSFSLTWINKKSALRKFCHFAQEIVCKRLNRQPQLLEQRIHGRIFQD